MTKTLLFFLVFNAGFTAFAQDIDRLWGTYFGGSNYQVIDAALDHDGNVYLYGMVYVNALPLDNSYFGQFVTPDAFQPEYGGNATDTFLVKFNPDGGVVWSTFYGGSQNDFAYGIEVDINNGVYIIGATFSTNGIATPGSFMPENNIPELNPVGFIAKFDKNGNRLWGTYYPGNIVDIVSDSASNVCFIGTTVSHAGISTPGAFIEDFLSFTLPDVSTSSNGFISKFNKHGIRIWGTYYGGANPLAVAIDSEDRLYITGQSYEPLTDGHFFATPNCYQSERSDNFISRFNPDGGRDWSTYFASVTHGDYTKATYAMSIAVAEDHFYLSGYTLENYSNSTATQGAFQTAVAGVADAFLQKFTLSGTREWGTLFGGNGEEWIDSFGRLSVRNNTIMLSGNTYSTQGMASVGAFKTNFSGGTQDSYFAKFNSNGSREWASYYGGSDVELVHGALQSDDDEFYIWGSTYSNDLIATPGSYQPFMNDDGLGFATENSYLAKFKTSTLARKTFGYEDLRLYPNPNHGIFTLKGNLPKSAEKLEVLIYDSLGRKITDSEIQPDGFKVSQQFDFSKQLSSGIYFARIASDSKTIKTIKLTVK